jgi:Zn-dependent protease/CBS domain-containing protein
MGWSFSIGRITGTEIRIHITFFLLLIWIFAASYGSGGADAAWSGVLFIILVFACVVAHEFGHIFAARAFGVNTPDVTLLPIGGVARLERIPEDPIQEFLIAIAGPLVNVAIVLLLMVFADANIGSGAAIENGKVSLVDRLASANLFLALFNIIPAFPMDGGRILRALLGIRLGFVRATEIAAQIGQVLAFVLGFVGLFYNPVLIFIAIFVYLAASSEAHMVALRAMSRGVPVSAAMMTQFVTLKPDEPIEQAVTTLLQTSQSEFPVVDEAGKPVGLLGRADIIRSLKELGPGATVAKVMSAALPTIGLSRCLSDALTLLQEKTAPAVAVVEADGRLAGLITSGTVGEMLMLQNAQPDRFRFGPWGRTQPSTGR